MTAKTESETTSIESTQFEEASVVLTRAFLYDPLTSAIIPDLVFIFIHCASCLSRVHIADFIFPTTLKGNKTIFTALLL